MRIAPSTRSARSRLPPTGATFIVGLDPRLDEGIDRVGWPAATDDLTGISAYGVGRKIDGGAWQTFVSSTTARTADRAAHVRAHVHVPRPGPRRRQELGTAGSRPAPRAEALSRRRARTWPIRGGWTTSKSSTASGGKSKFATRKGASATFTFTGRAYALVAAKSSGRGKVNLYVDGVFKSTVDLHRSKGLGRVVVCDRSWASSGPHTVKLVVAGTQAATPASTWTRSRSCAVAACSCPGRSSSSTAPAAAARGSCARRR